MKAQRLKGAKAQRRKGSKESVARDTLRLEATWSTGSVAITFL
jgi:hypothetical protein